MNIEKNSKELASATEPGIVSLNDECRPIEHQCQIPKSYNYVMVSTTWSNEVDQAHDMQVVNIQDDWHSSGLCAGAPCNHNAFRAAYQTIHPVVFRLIVPVAVDDETVRIATAQ